MTLPFLLHLLYDTCNKSDPEVQFYADDHD